ncbi:MAG: tryptophan--tRNA ligase [Ruminococcus sp.]|jgi:tryptophanyl-tRNA synthetase|nr:tryptophan--tRNA ligase [Ruminococcus sp.]
METKKTIFSGIQPTAVFTLGNFLGAIKNWGALQDSFDCVYSIVDMHAITVRQDAAKLREQTLKSYALTMACGIDPEKSALFIQSHNPHHAEMNWILSCNTQFGELSRMTQFKDKSEKHPDDINAGLFTYPVLMAGDILLYQADLVPIGIDQKQHLELARNVAERFNFRYGDFFTVPEPYIGETGAKIMSLQDPTKKMSKSDDNPNASVYILDDRNSIINKFKRAVTDSETEVRFDAEKKPGISNLMTIFSACTGKSFDEIEKTFSGHGYGDFKSAVGETVADCLKPIQDKYNSFIKDRDYLKNCYTEGLKKAMKISGKTLSKAYRKVGFVDKP